MNKFLWITLTSLFLFIMMSANASGIFLGANVGYGMLRLTNKHTFNEQGGGSNNLAKSTQSYSGQGFLAGLLLGYDQAIKKWHLAGQVFIEKTLIKTKYQDEYSHKTDKFSNFYRRVASTKLVYSYGILLLPGYQVGSQTTLFLLLGPVLSQFSYHYTNHTASQSMPVRTSNVHKHFGGQIGLGVRIHLAQSIALWVQTDYTCYQPMKLTSLNNNNLNRDDITPSVLEGKIGIVYLFG